MIGLVLGAGRGTRLGPLTEERPKMLLEVDSGRSILDAILSNFAAVGIRHTVVVGGHRIERLMAEAPRLESRHAMDLTVVANQHYRDRNNCFSLWLARPWFGQDILLSNGDTLHHRDIDRLLSTDPGRADLVLAVQRGAELGEEEMKVALDDQGRVRAINKTMPPTEGDGEYIGVARIRPGAAAELVKCLEAVISRDWSLYYEDAFQDFALMGAAVSLTDIGTAPWTEVDTASDLALARRLACRC